VADLGYLAPLADVAWHPLDNIIAVCCYAPLQPIHLLAALDDAPAPPTTTTMPAARSVEQWGPLLLRADAEGD